MIPLEWTAIAVIAIAIAAVACKALLETARWLLGIDRAIGEWRLRRRR